MNSRDTSTSGPAHGAESAVPVVLPHVLVRVHPDGTLSVTLDGQPFIPPEFAPAWQRSTFGELIDAVTQDRCVPVRVEVREVDGSTFTDIITPTTRRRHDPDPTTSALAGSQATAATQFLEFSGQGFVPGEDVAVAIVAAHTEATGTGAARALLDATRLDASPSGEVILLGRVSGTILIGRPR